jgi:hypothetical protein
MVRMTSASTDQIGTLNRPPVSGFPVDHFDSSFEFLMSPVLQGGGDGLCFGAYDVGIFGLAPLFGEYGPGSISAANSSFGSIAVVFDTFDHGFEGKNSIAIYADGTLLLRTRPTFSLLDSAWHRATIKLRRGGLTLCVSRADGSIETIAENLQINAPARVYGFGLGSRTDSATSEHWVDNWEFRVSSNADLNDDLVPDECRCRADFNSDGSIDFFDYLDFVDAFSLGDLGQVDFSPGDFNLDGQVDFFDYLDFVDVYSGGC